MRQDTLRANLLLCLCLIGVGQANIAFSQDKDVRKDATDATKAANKTLLDKLPFSDTSDFTRVLSRPCRPR